MPFSPDHTRVRSYLPLFTPGSSVCSGLESKGTTHTEMPLTALRLHCQLMVARAIASRLGLAESSDRLHFTRRVGVAVWTPKQ